MSRLVLFLSLSEAHLFFPSFLLSGLHRAPPRNLRLLAYGPNGRRDRSPFRSRCRVLVGVAVAVHASFLNLLLLILFPCYLLSLLRLASCFLSVLLRLLRSVLLRFAFVPASLVFAPCFVFASLSFRYCFPPLLLCFICCFALVSFLFTPLCLSSASPQLCFFRLCPSCFLLFPSSLGRASSSSLYYIFVRRVLNITVSF